MPERGMLIVYAQVFCRVFPLERPRKAPAGHMYQPHDNQKPLWQELRPYPLVLSAPIKEPVIVDIMVKFQKDGPALFPVAPKYGDEDNLRKAVNDGLVHEGILVDDRWIIGGETWKTFGSEDMAEIKIYKVRT